MHTGRPKQNRIKFCRLCNDDVEDKMHILFYCPAYDILEQKPVTSKYDVTDTKYKQIQHINV